MGVAKYPFQNKMIKVCSEIPIHLALSETSSWLKVQSDTASGGDRGLIGNLGFFVIDCWILDMWIKYFTTQIHSTES